MCFSDPPLRLQQLYGNGSHPRVYTETHFPYLIWQDEEMHALLVKAAIAAADAIASSGRSIRTGQHVLLRVDIVLTTIGHQASHICRTLTTNGMQAANGFYTGSACGLRAAL